MIKLLSLDEFKQEKEKTFQETVETDESVIVTNEVIDYSVKEWRQVKGIGPKLATVLKESGPYQKLEAIKNVKGIRSKIFESIETWHQDNLS